MYVITVSGFYFSHACFFFFFHSFSVFPKLIRKVNSGLHVIIIFFLFFAIGFALVSLAFCIYNARKVPYQSIKGPLGLYLWNFIAGGLTITTKYIQFSAPVSFLLQTLHCHSFHRSEFTCLNGNEWPSPSSLSCVHLCLDAIAPAFPMSRWSIFANLPYAEGWP